MKMITKMNKHRIIAWILTAAMVFTSGFGAKQPALAASSSNGNAQERVDEVNVAGRTCYMYVPASENVGLYTCTSPIIMVFGNENYTESSAMETAESSGLAEIAKEKGSCILFANSQSGSWTADDDEAVYTAALNLYSDGADSDYVNGIAKVTDYTTQEESIKYPGTSSRIYLYGEGGGADFIAANYMKDVLTTMTFSDGFSMSVDNTPTSIALFNPSAITVPEKTEDAIAVTIVNGPESAEEAATSVSGGQVAFKVENSDISQGFDSSLVKALYDQVNGRYRRQVGEMFEIPDYKALGITETVKTLPTTSGTTEYYEYIPDSVDLTKEGSVPLVVAFHGGGNHAEFHAWASEWPLLGQQEGFIVLAVNQHVSQLTDDVINLLNAVFEQYPAIDRTRVYATGFSMGSVKSWNLGTKYPEYFAGIMPMDAGYMTEDDTTLADLQLKDTIMPVFYVAGGTSPLSELPHQQGEPNNVDEILSVILKMNQVTDDYTYDAAADKTWGLKPDGTYTKANPSFKDCELIVNEYASSDGSVYTCLAVDTTKSHEVYAFDSYVAWSFISQFRRLEDGSIARTDTSGPQNGEASDPEDTTAQPAGTTESGTETKQSLSAASADESAGSDAPDQARKSKTNAVSPILYIIIGVAAVAAIAAIILYTKKKKRR